MRQPSLRGRLAQGLAVLACLLAILFGTVMVLVRQEMEQDISARNLNLAHAVAGETDTFLAQPEENFARLREDLARVPDPARRQAVLEAALRFTRVFEMVQVLDRSGRVTLTAPADPGLSGLDLSAQPAFLAARQGPGLHWSEAFLSAQTGEPSATLSSSLGDMVLTAHLSIRRLNDYTRLLLPSRGGFVCVTDRRGVVIGHSRPDLAAQSLNISNLQAVRQGLTGDSGTFREAVDGRPGLLSTAPVGRTSFTVLVFQPEEEAFGAVRRITLLTLPGLLALLLVAMLAARVFHRRLLAPIAEFSSQAEAVARRLYAGAPAPRYAEFGSLAASFADMTGQIAAREKELRSTRNFLDNIIDSMPSILLGVDPGTRITHWNAGAARSTGLSAGEALGRELEEVLPGLSGLKDRIAAALRERTPAHLSKHPLRLGGETRLAEVMVYPLATDTVEGAVVRVDDVTERAMMEEVMVQSEKMLSVGGLAAGMAHEINNPLGIILQGVQMALRRVQPDLPANQEAAAACGTDIQAVHRYLSRRAVLEYLEGVREAGSRAALIVRNMLDFSRRGESRMAPREVDRILDMALELARNDYDLKKRYDFRNVRIVREYAPDLPPIPLMDTEMEQVILNLLKNAAQAMHDKTYPEGQSPAIVLRTRQEGGQVVIEVEDNGPGMPEEVRRRVFEPFFTTKAVGLGAGLGLSVSYFIVTHKHRGEFTVRSAPDQGTTFTLRLPAAPQGDGQAAPSTL